MNAKIQRIDEFAEARGLTTREWWPGYRDRLVRLAAPELDAALVRLGGSAPAPAQPRAVVAETLRTPPIGNIALPAVAAPETKTATSRLADALALANKVEAAQIAKDLVESQAKRRADDELEAMIQAELADADAVTVDALLADERATDEGRAWDARERAAKQPASDPLADIHELVAERMGGAS